VGHLPWQEDGSVIYSLQFLLGLRSAVILGVQVPQNLCPYLAASFETGSNFATSYDSQGYGGSIITRFVVEVRLRPTVSRPVCLVVGSSLGAHDQSLPFLLFVCIFLDSKLGYSLWWEDGSVICIAVNLWPRSLRTHNHTLLSYSRLAQLYPRTLGSVSVASYNSQRLRWKYSCQPLHGETVFKVKGILRPTVNRPVCPGTRPPCGTRDQFSFSFMEIIWRYLQFFIVGRPLRWKDGTVIYSCCCASPSLSFSGLCFDNISLSQSWDSPNLECRVAVFICLRKRLVQLYPQAWDNRLEVKLRPRSVA
jgi:hypothetical protein